MPAKRDLETFALLRVRSWSSVFWIGSVCRPYHIARKLSIQEIRKERNILFSRYLAGVNVDGTRRPAYLSDRGREGGILAASRKLNTVQSNVTGRIRRLEEELGAELFHRTGRGLALAPPAACCSIYARRMLALERQTSATGAPGGRSAGERIGAMETFFAAAPAGCALTAVRLPTLGSSCASSPTPRPRSPTRCSRNKLDCAFIAGGQAPGISLTNWWSRNWWMVWPSAPTRRCSRRILFFAKAAPTAAARSPQQRSIGHATADAMEFGALEGILGCVSVRLGWTLMPRRVVAQSPHAAALTVTTLPDEISRAHRHDPSARRHAADGAGNARRGDARHHDSR